jgi:hypothetical protein
MIPALSINGKPHASMSTFYFIKANPGCTKRQALDALVALGFKLISVTSMLATFIRQKQIKVVGNGLFAISDEYIPLKSVKKPKKKPVKKVVTLPVVATNPIAFDADSFISTLSVRDAVTLYNIMNKLFYP